MDTTNVNFWATCNETGEGFLSYLRDSSHARNFCRAVIHRLITTAQADSLLEVGVGGLNEYLSLKDTYASQPGFRFTGTDWTPAFLEQARTRFPEAQWQQLDITQCRHSEHFKSDIVYSQHVLEHCPGLNPPLSNMLLMANKLLLNIFFIAPQHGESINFEQYPLYHNTYAINHIIKVCEHHGFVPDFKGFSNDDLPDSNECQTEVVLLAIRKEFRK